MRSTAKSVINADQVTYSQSRTFTQPVANLIDLGSWKQCTWQSSYPWHLTLPCLSMTQKTSLCWQPLFQKCVLHACITCMHYVIKCDYDCFQGMWLAVDHVISNNGEKQLCTKHLHMTTSGKASTKINNMSINITWSPFLLIMDKTQSPNILTSGCSSPSCFGLRMGRVSSHLLYKKKGFRHAMHTHSMQT